MNLLFEEYPAYAFVLSTDRLCYLSRDSTVRPLLRAHCAFEPSSLCSISDFGEEIPYLEKAFTLLPSKASSKQPV